VKFDLKTLEEYSDDALLAELRRVAETLKGQRLSIDRFNSLSRVHSTTLRYRFGSWPASLEKAGISGEIAPRQRVLSRAQVVQCLRDFAERNAGASVTRDAIAAQLGVHATTLTRRFGKWENLLAAVGIPPVPLGRRYTDEECFENILALWTHYGRQPHFAELNQTPSTVGSKAYVRRWGGWRKALGAFVRRVNETEQGSETQPRPEESSAPATPPVPDLAVPRSINLSLRYTVLSRDRFRCVLCGASPAKDVATELHVDHITPWSRGGLNVTENLRTLCLRCNLGKGSRIENAQPSVAADAPQASRR